MKKNLVNGEWIAGEHSLPNVNPSDTNDVIGDYAMAGAGEVELAIQAADSAAPGWARSSPQKRADILDFIGSEVLARRDELAVLLAREEGKTRPEALGEVSRAGAIFKFQAQEALRIRGEKMASVREGMDVEITREPVGTVAVITPWNFPAAIPAWKIAPALAYGNTVLFKPAELVPGSAWALAEIIQRSGLPPGVFNLLMGSGREVGQRLVADHRVRAVTFTGSVATGDGIAKTAVGRRAKVQLEMGGKNPLLVLDDADLELAVDCAVNGAFYSTGQRCTASSRLIVQKGIYQRFVNAVVERLARLKVGHALHAGVDIGPVVDERQLGQDLRYIEHGQSEGAKLAFGGRRLQRETPGFYLEPALFVDCSNSMRICQEEIFGPVAAVIPADSYEHALEIANDTEFGLSSGIVTNSLKHATDFKRRAKAGMVMVNAPTAGVDYHVPFGGTRASSYGSREQGSYAAEFFTTVKTAYCAAPGA